MNNRPNKTNSITIHILLWIVVLCIPTLVTYLISSDEFLLNYRQFIMPLPLVALFYINYCWLINRFLFQKKILLFILVNIIFVVFTTIMMVWIRIHLFEIPELVFISNTFRFLPLMASIITQALIIGLSVAIKMTSKWYESRQRVSELESETTKAELQQLKAQLNPHFLFNSLNNIYALVAFDTEKAQESIHSLCDMLRYQLYEANRETILISKEIEFVRSYCDLMRLRLSKQVTLDVSFPEDVKEIEIAPLLFVSIVENAFKHGVSQTKPSFISIQIVLNEKEVMCVVRNSYFPKTDKDRSGSGIGIENLRRRLELLYPDSHSFITKRCEDQYFTQLIIKEQ